MNSEVADPGGVGFAISLERLLICSQKKLVKMNFLTYERKVIVIQKMRLSQRKCYQQLL